MISLIFLATLLTGKIACADMLLDGALSLSQNSMGSAATSSNSAIYSRLGYYVSPGKGQFYLGVGLDYISQSLKTQATQTFHATEYNIGVRWSPTKTRWFVMGLSLSPTTSATFNDGTSGSQTWQGMSEILSLSFYYPMDSGMTIGLSLDYFNANYNRQITGTSTSSLSESVATFYPSIGFAYMW